MRPLLRTSRLPKQSGVTVIELMIAMVVGLVLVGGVLQVFSSARYTYRVHEATSRMQETGRMALEIIGRDVRMADFWGCASKTNSIVNNLDSTGGGFIDFATGGIGGADGGNGVPDTLILRSGSGVGLNVQPPYGPQPSAVVHIAPNNGFEQGDIIFVADCENADIFQISNANPDGSGQLVHNTGDTTEPGNYNVTNPGCPGSNAHCLSKVYGADASVFAARQIIYNVGTGSEGHPALFRNGQEFLDGIEDFQVLFGEDTDPPNSAGSSIANYFVPASQVVNMENVVSIRFSIVTRSYEDNLTDPGVQQSFSILGQAKTAADRRLRQVYTSTVAVRNRL